MTATFIKSMGAEFTGNARLYKLDPPMSIKDWDGEETGKTEFVVVSGAYAMFSGNETLIFPSDENGKVTDWGDLPGSFRGAIDHEKALTGAGYTLA